MSSLITLDLSEFDKDTQGKLNYFAKAIGKALATGCASFIEVGEQLYEARELLVEQGRESSFEAYVESYTALSRATAYRYIGIYEAFGDTPDCLQYIDQPALTLLSKASTPEAALREAIRVATKKTYVRADDAKTIIAKHTLEGEAAKAVRSPSFGKLSAEAKTAIVSGKVDVTPDNVKQMSKLTKMEQRNVVKKAVAGVPIEQAIETAVDAAELKEEAAEAEDDSGSKDDAVVVAPAHVRSAFAMEMWKQFPSDLKAMLRQIKKTAGRTSGSWFDLAVVTEKFEAAIDAIEKAAPYIVCPACEGKKCNECRNSGFMPKEEYDAYVARTGD